MQLTRPTKDIISCSLSFSEELSTESCQGCAHSLTPGKSLGTSHHPGVSQTHNPALGNCLKTQPRNNKLQLKGQAWQKSCTGRFLAVSSALLSGMQSQCSVWSQAHKWCLHSRHSWSSCSDFLIFEYFDLLLSSCVILFPCNTSDTVSIKLQSLALMTELTEVSVILKWIKTYTRYNKTVSNIP